MYTMEDNTEWRRNNTVTRIDMDRSHNQNI